ncbi:hypothetical protein NQ318_009996 [Aromia moschata]|uniref:Uncharacterized protein n=1 Tax=Aromia moschata TaxID=1265417 RepID=A0AAV8Y8V7_9CUCU|nr:hypothetical protein NQ318_009996 [Aromia moschata]
MVLSREPFELYKNLDISINHRVKGFSEIRSSSVQKNALECGAVSHVHSRDESRVKRAESKAAYSLFVDASIRRNDSRIIAQWKLYAPARALRAGIVVGGIWQQDPTSVNITKTIVHEIVSESLGMRKVCAKLVPKVLYEEKPKKKPLGIVKNFLMLTPFSSNSLTKSHLSCSSAFIMASSNAPGGHSWP